jgi:spermidine synthase
VRSPTIEILAYEPTPLGTLCLRRRTLLSRPDTTVTEIVLDHELLMSSYITTSERALARHALDMHGGAGLRVLIGGLGLGYTAHEVLEAGGERVAEVEVVEYLPQVIGWVREGLIPLACELRAASNLTIAHGDVYARLAGPPTTAYDLILIDVDHSPDEQLGTDNASFYTEAGLRRARRHLAPGGVLAVWSYAAHSPFATSLHRVFTEVRLEPITVWNDLVDEEQTDLLFLARG